VLILDEPQEGLDPEQRIEFRELIKGLAGKHTVILSTHVLYEVTKTCQKVLIIKQGKKVAFDDIDKLAASLQVEGAGPVSLEEAFIKLTAA